jgi:TRAP-type transport system small permease protein
MADRPQAGPQLPKETTMASVLAGRLSRGIAWLCAAILYITFGAIFFILCSDVFLRYFAGSSLRWASEIPELLFPWLAKAIPIVADERSPILGVPGSVTYICLFSGFVLIALVHLGELLHWTDERHEQAKGAF